MNYPLPRLSRVIANASKAVTDTAKTAIAERRIIVDDAIQKSRLSFCQTCEYYRDDGRCAHAGCGCFVKFKTYLYSQRCPAGKW